MKKTLLIAAAALAAGVISSQAQVYSQNIVGYVNNPLKTGFTTICNPLDQSAGNSLTNVVPPGSTWDGATVSTWTGTTYAVVTIDSTVATGVADAGDNFAVTAPTIAPGQAIFINNTGSSNTLTIVGTVHVDAAAAGAQTVGSSTNTIPALPRLSFVSSVIPVGGGVASVLGLTNTAAALDGCQIVVPNIIGGGVHGFNTFTYDSTMGTGFADAGDNFQVAEPLIPVGSGFFFNNTIGTTIKWVQSY